MCIEIAARPFVEWPRSRFEHDLCVSVFVTGLSGIEILCEGAWRERGDLLR